ncbi:MAG: asparaginase [Firmicutes bacterium]|nr:asparaginase [Bacillota bacterium]
MKILIITTGGTIGMDQDSDGVNVADTNKTDNLIRILNYKKERLGIAEIVSKSILNKDSTNIVMDDWKIIVQTIVDSYDDHDAFIITHGTDTMGYTMSAVSFALGNLGKPVCFTGAQAPIGVIGTDTIINLDNCLRVLAERKDLVGVFLVFGTQIVTGTKVKKQTELDYDAFKCSRRFRGLGVIGNQIIYNEHEIALHLSFLKPYAKKAAQLDVKNAFEPNIIALSEFPSLNPDIIINLADIGVKGFVIRSYGDGNPNVASLNATYNCLRSAFDFLRKKKIPIIVTTQTPGGVASMTQYQPAIYARELGAIPGNDISIEAATVKLSWLLAQGFTYEKICELLVTSIRGEIQKC